MTCLCFRFKKFAYGLLTVWRCFAWKIFSVSTEALKDLDGDYLASLSGEGEDEAGCYINNIIIDEVHSIVLLVIVAT